MEENNIKDEELDAVETEEEVEVYTLTDEDGNEGSFSWSMLRIDARFTSADKKRKAPASLAAAGAFETRRL